MADDDFRAKAMAMYQTRGTAATAEAAKAVKSSVRKDKSDALAKDDYRSMASKLYKAKGTEKLCEDCSKAGTRNARKKTAYYGMPDDRGLTVADRRHWCKACAAKHPGAVFVSADDGDDDDGTTALIAKISNKTSAMAQKAESSKKKKEEAEAADERGMFYRESDESSEEIDGDWSSSDEDEATKARRKKDREIQARKAQELRAKRKAEAEKTLAGKAKALKEKAKEQLNKEEDPNKKPGEMYIPDPTDPNQDGKPAGTFQDALDAKTDAEWERGFLRKQRYWLACCSFCKLCCLSFWTFIPVMLVLIKDFRCEITGPGCLATTMCHGHDDGMSTLNQFVGLSIDQIQIVNFRGSVDIIADMNQTGLGGVSLQGDPVDMAGLACTCDVDLENPNNVGCRGQAPVGETDKVCMPRVYVNVTKYAVTKDALGAIGIDAFLKDRVLVITATYDVIEGGWNLAACPEVVLTVVIPNVTSTTAGLGPLINVTLGYGVPRREPMWEPWLGKKMDHRGLIEFRSDPRLLLAGVHMTNHVPGGNITVSGVSTTHLAMQTVDGNLTVFGTDTSEIYMVAGGEGRVDITDVNVVSKAEITSQAGIEAVMEGVCSGDSDEADIPCAKTGAYGTSNREMDCAYAICVVDWFRVSDEDGAGLCCMDSHLRHVRGLRPHGSITIATNGGDISIDGVTGHPDVTLSTLGGDIEMLLLSDAFSGTYSLTAPKGGVEMSEKRFRTGYQFPAEVMTMLFPNSTAGFEAIIVHEQTQLGDEISTDGLERVLPLRGRVLSAEGGPYVGTQKMTMDAAAGSITICLTESVGGAKWGGNRTYVEKVCADAGGDPNTVPTTQCEIVTRSWTGPSDLDAEPDGSEPWFQPRGGAPYHSILNDQGEPELQGRWN